MHDLAYRQFELSYKLMLKRRVRATMQWSETHFEAVLLFLDICFSKLPTYFRDKSFYKQQKYFSQFVSKQARKGFRPISASQIFLGTLFVNDFLGNFWNSLEILWEFFGNFLGIFWEFFGNSLEILWEFFGNSLETLRGCLCHLCTTCDSTV